MAYKIALIKGDGIGPEIIDEAVKVLDAVAACEGFDLKYNEVLMGGAAYDIAGDPLPDETIEVALNSDAVLFGAIGGEKWDNLPREKRPESGLLRFRKEMGVFATDIRTQVNESASPGTGPLLSLGHQGASNAAAAILRVHDEPPNLRPSIDEQQAGNMDVNPADKVSIRRDCDTDGMVLIQKQMLQAPLHLLTRCRIAQLPA